MDKNVLIIDDSPTMRKMVKFSLKGLKYFKNFYEANDGLEALDELTKHEVELIICDVNMPNMNGLEFLRKVKEIESFQSIPIIMLTTEVAADDINLALELGATEYVKKPFKAPLLMSAVKKVLSL